MSLRQMVFSALSEPCRSMLAAELVQHAEELRASRPGLDTKGTKKTSKRLWPAGTELLKIWRTYMLHTESEGFHDI